MTPPRLRGQLRLGLPVGPRAGRLRLSYHYYYDYITIRYITIRSEESSLQDNYRISWKENHEQAFRCLVALLGSPPTQDITPDIARNMFKSSRIPTLPLAVGNSCNKPYSYTNN